MDLKEILKKYFKDALTEEALLAISTLFEAALNEKVKVKLVEKEAELEETNKVEMAKFKVELVNKLSEYSTVAVDEFVTENAPAIESEIKVNVSEAVMTGLMSVLKDQYIVVPEGETNVVADLEAKVAAVNEKLNDSINAGIESSKQITEYEKALTFKRLISEADVSAVDAEKVLDLLDGIDAEDVETFEEKTKIIIDKVVDDKTDAGDDDPNKKKDDLDESVIDPKDADDDTNDSTIDAYLP
jgi:hypothetical protein